MIKGLLYRGILPIKDYLQYRKLKRWYQGRSVSEEEQEILSYIYRTKRVRALNYPFIEKYERKDIEVLYDEEYSRYKVKCGNRYVFFKRGMTLNEVRTSWRLVCEEQDEMSPHKYISSDFCVNQNDTVVDAGVAEGNFSVECVDRVKKLILIECDEGWAEALRLTFRTEIESGKVVIIQKFLGDVDNENTVTLDYIDKEYGKIDFIKMDIEGFEQKALKGGQDLLENAKDLRLAVCTYHTPNQYDEIFDMLKTDFILSHTKRFMVFNPIIGWYPPFFRRGLIRAKKKH